MKKQELSERLKQIINEKFGANNSKFARAASIPISTLQAYLEGGSLPKIDIGFRVARAAGVTMEWLITGEEGPPPGRTEERLIGAEDVYEVPLVEGKISAGTGTVAPEVVKDTLLILKRYLGPSGKGVCRYVAVEVHGDSMEPELKNRDIVVIDRADNDMTRVSRDGLYAVMGEDDHIYVKRLVRKGHILQLVSANPVHGARHGAELIDLGRIKENPILGKVVYSIRRWK